MAPRERSKRLNDVKLVDKHKYHPEIKRINNHRFVVNRSIISIKKYSLDR